jgi:DNA repair photolyase
MENTGFLRFRESISYLSIPHPLFKVEASLSPYAGCSAGCVYCPFGFERKSGIKTDFIYNLERKLSSCVEPVHLGLGLSCEPYCANEKEFNVTRNSIELIVKHGFPLQVFTRAPLILRDIDIMKQHSENGLLAVSISVMSSDRGLTDIFEPGSIPPEERISLIKELNRGGIFSGAVLAPIIPYINDAPEQLESLFEKVKRAGGQYMLPSVLCSGSPASFDNFKNVLLEHFPNIFHRIDNLYEHAKFPAITYTARINDLLESLSRKYDLPLCLPTEKESCASAGIRQELLR